MTNSAIMHMLISQAYSGEGKSPGILWMAAGGAWISTLAISGYLY